MAKLREHSIHHWRDERYEDFIVRAQVELERLRDRKLVEVSFKFRDEGGV